ncbi:MAG: DNA polymerase III subunit chi, partial [Bauldia sp.]
TEVLFYHLQNQSLEAVLPGLLEKTIERGWKAVVQAGSADRVAALDAHLWTYRDESFLPHGTEGTDQPILLTVEEANGNGADVRFFVDGAPARNVEGYVRAVVLFDGNDAGALAEARAAWAVLKAAGHETTYWQQSAAGRWEKKAG